MPRAPKPSRQPEPPGAPATPLPVVPRLTPFQAHCSKWKAGCGSDHCDRARRVFVRGRIPCDVLFIGEAPGQSENTTGKPFIGPAGHLIDRIIDRALKGSDLTHALTNLVMCIPMDADGDKFTEPDDDQIESCAPRLAELVAIARPRMIVAVGRHAQDYTEPGTKWRVKFHRDYVDPKHVSMYPGAGVRVCIKHPSAILRMNVSQRGLEVQRCVVALATAAEFLTEHPEIKA